MFKFVVSFKLLDPDPDPDPEEPIIYGSDWIRIRNTVYFLGFYELLIDIGPVFSAFLQI